MNIIFIAPPGAGKGTQSEMLVNKYGLNHISTGDLLREEINSGSDLGKKIAEIINGGNLVSDDLMIEMLSKKIDELGIEKGIIFDGFPRTENQAIMLDKLMEEKYASKINYVFNLVIEKSEAMKRALGRILCPSCGKIYNVYFDKFDVDGYCNVCNSKLEKRLDDNEESFNVRFDSFISKTKPLIDFYSNKGILYEVKCGDKKEETFEKIEVLLNK
ncbi:MAG: nucleoside monophosphate kinase [Bacilli bacterium]|jgi:adenylate kinase|nr:nucleoside monophosphate kinase [Bacilli bacterium]